MTFGEAHDQILKGRVVARRAWPEFAKNFGIAMRVGGGHKFMQECEGEYWGTLYRPAMNDWFANDWEVVEALPPTKVRT